MNKDGGLPTLHWGKKSDFKVTERKVTETQILPWSEDFKKAFLPQFTMLSFPDWGIIKVSWQKMYLILSLGEWIRFEQVTTGVQGGFTGRKLANGGSNGLVSRTI